MKKRLIFVNNNLHSGGIQKSLLSLLSHIKGQYAVTLLLMSDTGEYKAQLPKGIQVLHCSPILRILGMSQKELWRENRLLFCIRSLFAALCRITGNLLLLRILSHAQKRLGPYDVAISCMHSEPPRVFYGGTNEIVLYRIRAAKKIAMVHADVLHNGSCTAATGKLYGQFDQIIACSKGCREQFVKAFPDLRDRVSVVSNFHRFHEIRALASQNPIAYPRDQIHVITVARLNKEKGIERALDAIRACVDAGIPIQYHIVGDGAERQALEKRAAQLGIAGRVTFYGMQQNPYRFMKQADLFLLPSYHEAAPLVFTEAKCLGVPILATRTASVQEMILDDRAGWVCENTTVAIVHSLQEICFHREALQEKREGLSLKTYHNGEAIRQWNAVMKEQEI